MRRLLLAALALTIAGSAGASLTAQPPDQDPVITSARQVSAQGNHDTAIAMLRTALASRPDDKALKQELVNALTQKQSALNAQLAELRREIAELRGQPVITGVIGGRGGVGGRAPVRVGGEISQPMKVRDVKPVYPLIALEARVQGLVILEGLIDEQGNVADVRVLRGVPLLNEAAVEAVRQWRYTPTLLNGVPVPVIMTMTVTFTLPDR
jgi:TonB family protein